MDEDETKHDERISIKPEVRGTRIPVATVLRHLAVTLDPADLFAAYPSVTDEDLQACLCFAADLLDGDEMTPAFAPRPRLARSLA